MLSTYVKLLSDSCSSFMLHILKFSVLRANVCRVDIVLSKWFSQPVHDNSGHFYSPHVFHPVSITNHTPQPAIF